MDTTAVESVPFFPATFWPALVTSIIFGILGMILAILGYKVFDWVTPKIDVEAELAQKQNVAVAIVCAAVILGVCHIVATVIH